MKKNFILFFFFCSFFSGLAQEKLGIANSNYSSTNSIFLNPSSSVDSRTFIQLNLIGANAYVITNQAYLPAFSIWEVTKGYTESPHIVTNKMPKFLYGKLTVDAPALIISHRRIGAGFFIRARSEVDIRRVPYQLTRMVVPQNLDTASLAALDINLRNVKFSNMTWVEYGVNFGMMVHKRNNVLITAGGNARYLTGINLVYANLQRLKAHTETTLVDIEKLKGKVRMSDPGWNAGKGFGLDAGITYKRSLKSEIEYEGYYVNSKKSGCTYIDYRYKIGLSLLDLGYIRFLKNTYKAGIEGSLRIDDYQQVKSLDSLIRDGFKTTVEYDTPILATLPTGLSAQVDMNLSHHFFLNVTAIKSVIPAFLTGVQRANLLSIAPRFEHRQIEVALPLTFHRFIYPQLGFAFRIRSFVLGMDNVFPLITEKNTYGLNLYFNLGVSLFKNPACRQKKHRTKKIKTIKRTIADCPKFGKSTKSKK